MISASEMLCFNLRAAAAEFENQPAKLSRRELNLVQTLRDIASGKIGARSVKIEAEKALESWRLSAEEVPIPKEMSR